MLDDLSNIKKKQLVKQSQTIIENKNKIQQIHQLDLTEAPKGSKAATKKKNSKPSSSSASTTNNSTTTPIIEEKLNSSSTCIADNSMVTENDLNVNLQNHLIKLAEVMQGKDSELAEFYMRRYYLESACSDSVNRHSSNYVKSCQFCGHSFLDRNNGYQLAKQNSTKVVIKDVTKGDKLCSLNLKQFFTSSKNEKMKWSHIVCCLCSPKDANNNVLTFKCKQCQKYLIIPFDKTIASQIIPTRQKTEQKSEAQNPKEESKTIPKQSQVSHSKSEEKPTNSNHPSNNATNIEKKNKKQSNPANDSQKKEQTISKDEQEKKRKREDTSTSNNNSNKNNSSKKKKNKKETSSASDFLKLL